MLRSKDLVVKTVQFNKETVYTETTDKTVYDKATEILSKLLTPFDLKDVVEKYPFCYEETLNTVFLQEVTLYNCLLDTINSSLTNILKAIKGVMVMSTSLDDVYESILKNRIPSAWSKKSYPSLKSLGCYISDFLERLMFMQKWFNEGIPASFWISGFFRVESFLTGILQNHAHQNSVSVKTLVLDFQVISADPSHIQLSSDHKDAIKVHGLFLEGARWDLLKMLLEEALPRINYDPFPTIALIPRKECEMVYEKNKYVCPVYKTCDRQSSLADVSHSPNFVVAILLDTKKPAEHWILRGVALLTQLSD